MKGDKLDDFKVPKHIKKKLDDTEWLKKELAKGKTAKEILQLTDKMMAEFYDAAHELYEHEYYGGAGNAFMFLVTLNPTNPEYWLGLGMSMQKCGQYEDAIHAYEMAAFYKFDSPIPYFYLAKCLFAVQDGISALQALDLALEFAADQAEFAELRQQAMLTKKFFLGGE
ncbi:MAG: SycD/LcrH family type III secretion system chaperone [Waddliaceae bacterium]